MVGGTEAKGAARRCRRLASPVLLGVLASSGRLSAEEGTWWGIGDKLARGPMFSSATKNADACNLLSSLFLFPCLSPCLFCRRRPDPPWTCR